MMYENVPEWWILLIGVALLSLLIFWDVQSLGKRRRVWRLSANALIVVCFLGLYLKPYVEARADRIKIALHTASEFPIEADSLLKRGFEIIDFDTYLKFKSTRVIEEMIVLGDGLETWELSQVAHTFEYLESKRRKEGPLEVSTNEAVTNTRTPITFRIAANDPMDIHLSGTGIGRSMKPLNTDSETVTFDVNPQVAGNLTYELIGVREIDTLFKEIVPMKVRERTGFSTLILTSAPSFEIRFLKNLLKEEGYGVAERLQVSKETFRESFSNLNNRSLKRLSRSLLQDFKVLVLDKESYDELSYSERQNLNAALKKGTLGIIWLDDASNAWLRTRTTATQTLTLKTNQQSVELDKSISSIGYDQQVKVQGNVIGHVHTEGLGKVLLPLLDATYQLQLKGHDQLYRELWNALLQPIVGAEMVEVDISIPNFPRADEPTTFAFRTEGEEQVYLDFTRLAIKEKWHQPGVFTSMGWPTGRGWSELKVGEQTHTFFVYGSADWQAQKAQQKREQTTVFVSQNSDSEVQVIKIQQPVSKWIFFSVLVLAFGFLWIEGRLG
ncbi:MAG: hypothetical protein ABJG47_12175 [Ekhidna sp.]